MFTSYAIPTGGSYGQYLELDAAEQAYWEGMGARLMGLAGEVRQSDFDAVRQGIDPGSGEKVRQLAGQRDNSIALYDCVIAAPKSLSVMSLYDQRLLSAHHEGVSYAQRAMESLAMARVHNRDGSSEVRYTNNVVQAVYPHAYSRAGDVQRHTHLATINMTYDREAGQWKALNPHSVFEHSREISEVYRHIVAQRVEFLGYTIADRANGHGFEIAGVPAETLAKFSQRSAERDAAVAGFREHHGRGPTVRELTMLVRNHRPDKTALVPYNEAEFRESQLARLTPDENRQLMRLGETALERRILYEINVPHESYSYRGGDGQVGGDSGRYLPQPAAAVAQKDPDPERLQAAQKFAIADRLDHEPELRQHPWEWESERRYGWKQRAS